MLGPVKARQGYSLVEVLIVVAIIGTLTAIAVPNFLSWNDKYRLKSDVANLAGTLGLARRTAINQNTTVLVSVCHLTAVCPGATVNATPAQVTVFFQNATTLQPIAGLSPITMDGRVRLTNAGGGAVVSPHDLTFNIMGTWVNTGNANNICIDAVGVAGACPLTSQVLNFRNAGTDNFRIVVLPTGKIIWCSIPSCIK